MGNAKTCSGAVDGFHFISPSLTSLPHIGVHFLTEVCGCVPKMFACPGEDDVVIYECNGMMFRSSQAAMAGADHGFREEPAPASFTGSVQAPATLAAKIEGKKKSNIQMLRRQTKTKITTQEDGPFYNLIVTADTQERLDNAIQQIQALVDSVANERPFSHFVAIPCVSDKLFVDGEGGMRGFLNRVNQSCNLSSQAWENLNRLHFTLLTLRLEEEECAGVQKIIDQVVSEFEWREELEIEIAGINVFNDGEHSARLFYAQPRACDALVEMRRLQEALAVALRAKQVQIVDVVDVFHITLIRRSWCIGGVWAGEGMMVMAAEFQPPPAPLDGVCLCRRSVWKRDSFYYTYGKAQIQSRLADILKFGH